MGRAAIRQDSKVFGASAPNVAADPTTAQRGTPTQAVLNGVLGTLRLTELAGTPVAPGADQALLYLVDSGAGKTQLMVIFNTGAAQLIKAEP